MSLRQTIVLTACLGLAACSPTSPNPTPSPSASPVPSASTASPVPSASPVPVSPRAVAVPACLTNALTVAASGDEAASGHRGVVLLFVNVSAQPCQLHGYPSVLAVNATGATMATAKQTLTGYMGGAPVATVLLNPGQSGSALVEAVAFNVSDGSACKAYANLHVSAPGDTASAEVPWSNDGCSDLQVHPIVAGATGRTTP